LAGDTDSCEGSTIIKTENGDIKIEDLYKQINGKLIIDDKLNNNFIKECNNKKAYGVNDEKEIVLEDINYIMKHKVKKRMYKIKVKNKEVIVTADHSIIVLRNEKLIGVKPGEIQKTDKVLYIC